MFLTCSEKRLCILSSISLLIAADELGLGATDMAERRVTGHCVACGRETLVRPFSERFTVKFGACERCKNTPWLAY